MFLLCECAYVCMYLLFSSPPLQNGGRLPRPDHAADAAAVVAAAKAIAATTAGCDALNEAVIAELARGSSASIGTRVLCVCDVCFIVCGCLSVDLNLLCKNADALLAVYSVVWCLVAAYTHRLHRSVFGTILVCVLVALSRFISTTYSLIRRRTVDRSRVRLSRRRGRAGGDEGRVGQVHADPSGMRGQHQR
jgi:hypothetical protein